MRRQTPSDRTLGPYPTAASAARVGENERRCNVSVELSIVLSVLAIVLITAMTKIAADRIRP